MDRRTLLISLTVFVIVALLIVVSVAAAQGGRQGGRQGAGQGGTMGTMMYLERSWTAVSFQLDCTSEQLAQLRPTYRNTLNARNEAIKEAMANRDREAMVQSMKDTRTRLNTKLKSVLSDSQWTKLERLMTMGGGGRRGGQGGGNQ